MTFKEARMLEDITADGGEDVLMRCYIRSLGPHVQKMTDTF